MFGKPTKSKKVAAVRKSVQPKKRLTGKWLVRTLSVFAIAAVVFGIKYMTEAVHLFPIEHVRIEGEFKYLDKDKIEHEIGTMASGGFFDIDIAAVRDRLVSMQWIEDAFVRREWPSSVVIRVVEKEPVAKWNGKGVLTDGSDLFYPEQLQLDTKLPELEGPESRHEFVLAEFNKIQSQLYQADITISKLSQNRRRSWKMLVDNIEINLGRKNIYKKIESFVAVYQTLLKPKINEIDYIDFRYTNGFAVKWKENVSAVSSTKVLTEMSVEQNSVRKNYLLGTV